MSKHLHTSRCAHVHLPLSRAPVSLLTIILSLSQVPLSPCRHPPCHFHGRLCHPVTVSLSLSRVPLSPCDCLPVTVVSSSVTPHRLPVSVAGVSVTLSLSQGVSVTPHPRTVSVAGVSVTLLLSHGVSVTLTVTLLLSRVPLSPLTASLSLLQVSLSPCHHVTVSLSLS